jgi:signal peptidase I
VTTTEPTAAAPARDRSRGRGRRNLLLVAVALLLALLLRTFVVQAFSIPSASMEPTLEPGQRVLVWRGWGSPAGAVQRGDVVVFNGTGTFTAEPAARTGLAAVGAGLGNLLGFRPDETDFVKRVVGLPGDHVVCCDAAGRLTVNGTALEEPYVAAGDAPSEVRFDVIVPAGRVWVMGDHRSESADSRAHLAGPGGGTIALDDVVGRVIFVTWPLSDVGTVARGAS